MDYDMKEPNHEYHNCQSLIFGGIATHDKIQEENDSHSFIFISWNRDPSSVHQLECWICMVYG